LVTLSDPQGGKTNEAAIIQRPIPGVSTRQAEQTRLGACLVRALKNAICYAPHHPSSLRRTGCTPHSSGFARLASHRLAPACPQYCLSTGFYSTL